MDGYQIIITPDAESDLIELRNYISDVLMARDTARSYVRAIREEIAALNEMPARYKAVDLEPWRSRGIRRVMAKNFYIYYRVEEKSKQVFILNIIYARRDQLQILERMNTDG